MYIFKRTKVLVIIALKAQLHQYERNYQQDTSMYLAGKKRDAQLLVDHKGQDSHHGGTALVELGGTLLELGLGIESVPAKVDQVVTEVTNEFVGSSHVTHDRGLQATNKEQKLDKSSGRDGLEGGESVGDGGKGGARQVNGSWKTDTSLLDEVSNNGKHGNTSVLDFYKSQAVELFLVTISNKSKRIKELYSERKERDKVRHMKRDGQKQQ
jgi:hypothetical protein